MNVYLFPGLQAGPTVFQRLLAHLPESAWDTALDPDRFTLREVYAHLADWEPIMHGRMVTAVASPGAPIEAYDEGQMAIDNGYAQLDPRAQADLFARHRATTIAWLHSLTRDDWDKTVKHPERGEMTVYDQACLLLGHDLYHIEQVSAYLKQPG